jgi:hypothetical protein
VKLNTGEKMNLTRPGALFFLLVLLSRTYPAYPAERQEDEILPPDQFEPDSQARPLTVHEGNWISRNLHDSTDEDWFLFTANSRGILTAETAGNTDTVMTLFIGNSIIVKNDDRNKNNSNARIEYFTEPGITYIIKVNGYIGAAGPYRFRVFMETLQTEKTEPNDTQAQAVLAGLDSTVTAYFHSPDDVDWFYVKVPQAGTLILRTEGSLDTILELYDSKGNLIAESDRGGAEDNALIILKLPADTYFIKVREYENRLGKYYLEILYREPGKPDKFEDDDEMDKAKDIQIGFPQERNFTSAADVDWVRLPITREGIYAIGAVGHTDSLDTHIELFDQNGNGIAADDDSGGNLNALLTVNLIPGLYYIKVSAAKVSAAFDANDGMEYTLNVVRLEE